MCFSPLSFVFVVLGIRCLVQRKKPKPVGAAAPKADPKKDEPKPAPGAPVEKKTWEIKSSAYIGFGKAKMDVDFGDKVPESAPHEMVRKESKIVVADGQAKNKNAPPPSTNPNDYEAKDTGCLETIKLVFIAFGRGLKVADC